MSEAGTLSTKGQIVVPKAIRERLGWRAGTQLFFEERGDHVVLRGIEDVPETTVEDLLGCAGYSGPARTVEEMNAGVAREVARRYGRGRDS